MATYNTVWAWIIPTRSGAKKVFTEAKAKKTAAAAGIAWGQVKKQKQGVRAQIRRRGHRPQSQTFETKGQAETWAKKVESDMDAGTFQDLHVARGLTVRNLLDRYSEDRVMESSERSRLALLKRKLGHITLDQLNSEQCLAFVKARRGTKAERLKAYGRWVARQVASGELEPADAPELMEDAHSGGMPLPPVVQDSTIWRDLDVLGSAIAWGKDHLMLHIVTHPLPDTKKYLVFNNERSRRPTEDELEKIFHVTDSPFLKSAIAVAIETAMRRGELCRIRIEDIQWDRRIAVLRSEKADRLKKGRSAGREVPLSKKAIKLLKAQVGERHSGRVFELEPNSITQAFGRACVRAKIRDLVFHDLRHHSLSLWAEQGKSEFELMKIGGHRDARSLARYLHGKAEAVAKNMDGAVR